MVLVIGIQFTFKILHHQYICGDLYQLAESTAAGSYGGLNVNLYNGIIKSAVVPLSLTGRIYCNVSI